AEVDRQTDPKELDQLEQHLLRVIGEVRAAVEDWPAMRQRAREIAAELAADPPAPLDPADVSEGAALLEWLLDEHFTVLGYLDYVGIKRFDEEGRVTGERRFLGLYTTTAYNASPREIPILRRKVDLILQKAAFPHGSHNEKALIEILENHPRDEIFQVPVDEL